MTREAHLDILVNCSSCIGSSVTTMRTLPPDLKSTMIVLSYGVTSGKKSIVFVIATRWSGLISVNRARTSWEMGRPIRFTRCDLLGGM